MLGNMVLLDNLRIGGSRLIVSIFISAVYNDVRIIFFSFPFRTCCFKPFIVPQFTCYCQLWCRLQVFPFTERQNHKRTVQSLTLLVRWVFTFSKSPLQHLNAPEMDIVSKIEEFLCVIFYTCYFQEKMQSVCRFALSHRELTWNETYFLQPIMTGY